MVDIDFNKVQVWGADTACIVTFNSEEHYRSFVAEKKLPQDFLTLGSGSFREELDSFISSIKGNRDHLNFVVGLLADAYTKGNFYNQQFRGISDKQFLNLRWYINELASELRGEDKFKFYEMPQHVSSYAWPILRGKDIDRFEKSCRAPYSDLSDSFEKFFRQKRIREMEPEYMVRAKRIIEERSKLLNLLNEVEKKSKKHYCKSFGFDKELINRFG